MSKINANILLQASLWTDPSFSHGHACLAVELLCGACEVFQRGGSASYFWSGGSSVIPPSGVEWVAPGRGSSGQMGGTQLLLQTHSRAPFPPSSRVLRIYLATTWVSARPKECVLLLKMNRCALRGPPGLLIHRFPTGRRCMHIVFISSGSHPGRFGSLSSAGGWQGLSEHSNNHSSRGSPDSRGHTDCSAGAHCVT